MHVFNRWILMLVLATLPTLAACEKTGGMTGNRTANSGDIVTVHFTGKTADGKVFETTEGGKPRQVHIGANLILPAFEQALIGMKQGEKKTFSVKSEQAYGPRIEDETMIQVNYKSNQAHALNYRVGQKLEANIEYPDGHKAKREVIVIAVDEKTFTVDANHPLAGKDLSFDAELVKIQ
jgi:peptidylprolyl isomerase